jgi:hypothetical protein
MAALVAVKQSTIGAGGPPWVAADPAGDKVLNPRGDVALWVFNQSAALITVTIAEGRFCSFLHAHQNDPISIDAGVQYIFHTYRPDRWNDTSGYLSWTYSSVTNVLVVPVQIEERFRG